MKFRVENEIKATVCFHKCFETPPQPSITTVLCKANNNNFEIAYTHTITHMLLDGEILSDNKGRYLC